MRALRVVLVGLVCFGALGMAVPSGADSSYPSMTLSSSSVAPGGRVTVSGICPGLETATIALLDENNDLDIATAAAAPDGNGVWSAPISVPPWTQPGTYALMATCDGYIDGYIHLSLRPALLTVLPPPPPPPVPTLGPPLPEAPLPEG
jgi:hypothetical protein